MNFDIVTDSACNLPEGIIDEFNLHVLPLTFMVDGQQYQSYLKGAHTDLKQFYTMMREGKVITTSLPNMSESEKLLRSLLEAGRDVLYLGFSSGLSGTFGRSTCSFEPLRQNIPDARSTPSTRWPLRAERGCWSGTRRKRKPATGRYRRCARLGGGQ